MSRLSLYLSRQYVAQGMALFSAVIFLVWITQALRLFDLVTDKGQSLLTLLGQSVLTTPPLSRAMLHICIGIGIVRTLEALQSSHELHTIHATQRMSALWSSILFTSASLALVIGLLAHWIEPLSYRSYGDWTEQVAADLVGRALEPHQFREVTPGFVVQIEGRMPDGTITGFFADDSRGKDNRRTYEARRATINSDEHGLYLALEDGRIQHQAVDLSFTEIKFAEYQLGLESITQETPHRSVIDETTTFEFYGITQERELSLAERQVIERRWMEMALGLAVGLFAVALAGFPRGRNKGPFIPFEVTIIAVAFTGRIVSDQIHVLGIAGLSGVIFMAGLAVVILAARFATPYLPRIGKKAI